MIISPPPYSLAGPSSNPFFNTPIPPSKHLNGIIVTLTESGKRVREERSWLRGEEQFRIAALTTVEPRSNVPATYGVPPIRDVNP